MTKINILTGSVRPGRFNTQPAEWLADIAENRDDAEFELVDIAELNLPFMNEVNPPMAGKYELPHTKAWARMISEADGFVFVTPEYNHSVSPVLKNAIDYLYKEWNYKPVAFISYGSAAGGSRAVEHLRGIAAELKMYDLREQLLLPNYWNDTNDKGDYNFTEDHETQAARLLDQVVFWAETMRTARNELASPRLATVR